MWKRVFAETEGIEFAETRVTVEARLEAHNFPFPTSQRRAMLVWSVEIL